MVGVITQMAALIVCGILWRSIRPGGLDADATRRVLTTVVYYLLLPALVLVVLWRAPLGLSSIKISLLATAGVALGLLLTWGVCRVCQHGPAVIGAMVLAAAFPNATYLGLPVLAVVLNLTGVPVNAWLVGWLEMLAAGVVPLMLFSLGLSLRLDTWRLRYIPPLVPVIVIQLLLAPLLVWGLGSSLGLTGTLLIGVVLEAAMPSMVLGIVFCDRYGLDTSLYAAAVTVTTALSLITLPLWYGWLSQGLPAGPG